MISLLSLFMEAHDEEMNIHRFYAITVGKNLFGLAIHIEYGRKELFRHSRGQHKTYRVDSLVEAQQKVTTILKKRFSSPRRDGKALRPPYAIIDASINHDTQKDFQLSDWVKTVS